MSQMLKLNGLADVMRAEAAAAGQAPQMAMKKIRRDPNNLRPPFEERTPKDQTKSLELYADIAARGVKAPISLRPDPERPDHWIINAGHDRYEGAERAGMQEIPYFVDKNFDSYDQVNENELRSGLTPWALATFIAGEVKKNVPKGEIATRLRKKNQNAVTEYLALIDPPACLINTYNAGVRSPRTLYELRKAWEEFPDQVDAWCAGGAKITRETIAQVLVVFRSAGVEQPAQQPLADDTAPRLVVVPKQELRHDETPALTAPAVATMQPEFRHDETKDAADADITPSTPEPVLRHDEKPAAAGQSPASQPATVVQAEQKSAPTVKARVQRVVPQGGAWVMVEHNGKPAKVMGGAKITIIPDDTLTPKDVLLSELVFLK
jgi:ParB/RepB/Spo0J family partition protein